MDGLAGPHVDSDGDRMGDHRDGRAGDDHYLPVLHDARLMRRISRWTLEVRLGIAFRMMCRHNDYNVRYSTRDSREAKAIVAVYRVWMRNASDSKRGQGHQKNQRIRWITPGTNAVDERIWNVHTLGSRDLDIRNNVQVPRVQ